MCAFRSIKYSGFPAIPVANVTIFSKICRFEDNLARNIFEFQKFSDFPKTSSGNIKKKIH